MKTTKSNSLSYCTFNSRIDFFPRNFKSKHTDATWIEMKVLCPEIMCLNNGKTRISD